MSAPLLDLGCTIVCPHGGQATVIPSNTRVSLGGAFALLPTDTMVITGCALSQSGTQCVSIQWMTAAMRDGVNGTPPLLQTSVGLCVNASGAPQGAAIVIGGQTNVGGI